MSETVEEVKEERDEEPEGWDAGPRGPDKMQMVSNYLPEKNDWSAKSILDTGDGARVAALKNFDKMFPEVEELQPLINSFLDEYLKAKVSEGGVSRVEFKDILVSLFGHRADEKSTSGKLLKELLAADADEE